MCLEKSGLEGSFMLQENHRFELRLMDVLCVFWRAKNGVTNMYARAASGQIRAHPS